MGQAIDNDAGRSFDRPPWAQRRFAFGHPPWMLADFIERLRGLIPRLEPLLAGVGEDDAHVQHEGKWSIAQNVGHLADVEDLWQERLEDLREGRPVYTPAQPARFQQAADRHQHRRLESIVEELAERRSRLVDALAGAPASLQEASAFHERLQVRMRLVDCAQFYAEHDDHHLIRIRALRSILGDRAGAMRPQPLICVKDVEASSRWYQRLLGCQSAHGGPNYERLVAGGRLVLQLHRWDVGHHHGPIGDPDDLPPGNGLLLWFEVDDIDAAIARAASIGAEVLLPRHRNPPDGDGGPNHWEIWLRDPDGYKVVLASPDGSADGDWRPAPR